MPEAIPDWAIDTTPDWAKEPDWAREDQPPVLEVDESGLPTSFSPRQRKRLELGSEMAAEQAAQEGRDRTSRLISPVQDLAEGALTALSFSPSAISRQFERGIPATAAAIQGKESFTPLPPVVSESLNPGENRAIKIPSIPTTKETPIVGQVGAGLGNAVIAFANIFTTPEGIASLGIGGLPKEAQRTVIGTMAANLAAQYPDQFSQAIDAAQKGDYATATEKIVSTPVMAAVMGRGSVEMPKVPKAPEFPGLPDPDLVARNIGTPGTMRPQELKRFNLPDVQVPPEMFEAGEVPFNRMQRFGGQQIPPVDILPRMGRIENVPILEEPRPIEQRETRGKVSFGAEAPTLLRESISKAEEVGLTKSAEAAAEVARGDNRMPPYRAPKPATPELTRPNAAQRRANVEAGLTMENPPMEPLPPEVAQFPPPVGMPSGTLSRLQSSRIQAGKQNVRSNVRNNPPQPQEPNAPTITSPAKVDVGESPGNGEAVGKGNTEVQAPAEVRPEAPKRKTLKELRDELENGPRNTERGGIDPTILEDIAAHGRTLLKKGMEFAEWSAEMVKQFGESIKDHLEPVWKRVSEIATAIKEAPVVYRGRQEGFGKIPAMELYNLTEDISPTLVKGSTVTEASLAKEGFTVPESVRPKSEGAPKSEPVSEASKPKTLSQLGRDLPDAGESGGFQLPIDEIHRAIRKVRDFVTIDPIPRLTRAMGGDIGTGNNSAIQHASARVAVPRMVDDILAKVFPDQYGDPKAMQQTMEILNKDNILGGYDAFIQRAVDAQAAGHASAAAHWRQMARDVANNHDLPGYEHDVRAAAGTPAVADNIKRWNDVVNPQLDQLYNEMKGMDPSTPREGRGRVFGARVNLLSKAEEGRWIDALSDEEKPLPSPSSSNYRNPNAKKDKFDRRAKFTGEYSDNPAAVLANVLAHRYNEVTKIRFLNDLIRSGAGSWEKPASGLIHGQEAKPLPVKLPETKTEMVNGVAVDSATKQVERTIWVPEDVVSDVRGILDTDLRLKQNPVAKVLTGLQLAQLADAFTHTKNLHSVIANAQGTKALWSDVARKMPLLSTADSAVRLTKVLYDIAQDTPEIRAELADMAKNGMLRQHFPATGIQKVTKMQDMIHHVDTASRVVMNRFYDNLVERGLAVDTMPARRKFVQQVGEYNKRLMGPMMQSMSRAGFSPFIVAGRNFNRFGRRLLTGHPGFETTGAKAELQARLVNFATLGAIFTLPMMVNQVLTGSIWGRKGTPLASIDLNQPVDEKGAHKVLDLASLYGVRRGMRATGMESIAEGIRAGRSPDEIIGGAINNVASTASHPWMGPALGAAYSTLTGQRLDLRGGPTPTEARKVGEKGSASQFGENARVALKNQNPLLYSPFRPLFKDTEESFGKDIAKDFLRAPGSSVGVRDVKSPALAKAGELMGSHQKTIEQDEKAQIKQQAVKALHGGDKSIMDKARKEKTLNQRDITDVKDRAKDPLVFMVKKLGAEDSIKVWELASEEERKTLKAIINQKILNSEVLDLKEKRRLREQLGTLKPIQK